MRDQKQTLWISRCRVCLYVWLLDSQACGIVLPLIWRKSLSNYIETHCLVAFLVNFTDATCLGVIIPLASTIWNHSGFHLSSCSVLQNQCSDMGTFQSFIPLQKFRSCSKNFKCSSFAFYLCAYLEAQTHAPQNPEANFELSGCPPWALLGHSSMWHLEQIQGKAAWYAHCQSLAFGIISLTITLLEWRFTIWGPEVSVKGIDRGSWHFSFCPWSV